MAHLGMLIRMSATPSSKSSLSSFGYRVTTLAGAGILPDEIPMDLLPVDLYREIEALLDFSMTVPMNTLLVRR